MLSLLSRNFNIVKAILKILSSGFLTSLGFIILSSNRVTFISLDVVIKLLLFLQLHAIGLTISKLGYDLLSYANYLNEPNLKPNISKFILKKSLPLCVVIFFIASYKFDFIISSIILINVLIDQYSTLVISQLGFRHQFNKIVFLNLLSYPLFFITIIVLSYLMKLVLLHYVIIFSIYLFIKFVFSYFFYEKLECTEIIELKTDWFMGIQQIFNYFLFKADLILLSLPLIFSKIFFISEKETIEILFLSRFPELISGILISLSVLYYPKFYFSNQKEFKQLISFKLIIFYSLSIIIALFVFLEFWRQGFTLNIIYVLIYFLIAYLVIYCNLISFNLLRDKKQKLLIENLLVSVFVGLIYLLVCITFSIKLIFLLVLVQMLTFIYLYTIKHKNV